MGGQLSQREQARGDAGHEADFTPEPDGFFQPLAGSIQTPGRHIGETQVAHGVGQGQPVARSCRQLPGPLQHRDSGIAVVTDYLMKRAGPKQSRRQLLMSQLASRSPVPWGFNSVSWGFNSGSADGTRPRGHRPPWMTDGVPAGQEHKASVRGTFMPESGRYAPATCRC
jgi:hypothetical protein